MAIKLERDLDFPPREVWAIVGQPDRVDWVPGVEGCVFDGEVREFKLPGAGAIKERILKLDDEAMCIEYSAIESPIPLDEHWAAIKLEPREGGCRLIWETRVQPEQFEKFIVDSMEGCLVRIAEISGSKKSR